MKTLVVGAVAVLLGSAALVVTAAPSIAADDPTPTASQPAVEPSGGVTPEPTAPAPPESTPEPTAPALPRHAQPVKPPAPPCGSTLDDVAWPSTPGIAYSHDEWNGYARLLPGYEWVNSDFNAITGWWLLGGTISGNATLVWLPRQLILNPTGKCGANPTPPQNSRPDSPCWYGLANPKPCPAIPVYEGPRSPGSASTTRPGSPAPTASQMPTTVDAVTPEWTPAAVWAPPPTRSSVSTPEPSPAPSPSGPPGVQADPRVATTTGLGVAGGIAGACVLAAAGAFVVRLRRPTPLDTNAANTAEDE
jgi:hypothetical protein